MPRPMTFLALCLLGLGSVAHGDEPSKDDAMKAWSSFVGKWKLTMPNGNTATSEVTRSRSNSCFVHQAENATHVVGWDSGTKSMKSITFGADGGHAIGQWKVAVDGPKFSGEMKSVGADGTEGPPLTITITFVSNDRWELVSGEAKISAERSD